MKRKAVSGIMLMLLLVGMLALAFNLQPVKAELATTTVPDYVNDNKIILEGTGTPQWLDPHVSYYQFDYWILQNTMETLLWYNGSSATDVIPWLAESWTKINNYQYEFTLRQGIKFQDGTPFNATAVWFSFNRLLIKDGTSGSPTRPVHGSQAAWMVQQLLNFSLSSALGGSQPYDEAWVDAVLAQNFVEIVDDYKIRLNIQHPTTRVPWLLVEQWAAIVSPSSVILKDYEFHGWGTWDGDYRSYFVKTAGVGNTYFCVPEDGWKIGTGPYILESFDPTTYHWVLKKNPDYWGGPPDFELPVHTSKMIETIEYNYVENFSTRLLDLEQGRATGIAVPQDQVYSVIDRDLWVENGTAIPIIPDMTWYGPYSTFVTDWMNLCSNVTDADGNLLEFQPMADRRIRLAICHSINLTEANINIMNGMNTVATNLIPPNTAPAGAYNPAIKPPWTYNLTKAAELLIDAMNNPITEFTFYNGAPIPPGIVDNSFGPSKPRTIELYVPSGATSWQEIWTTIAENINSISIQNDLGLTFAVVPVPIGQQYTLAMEHRVYAYWGGWVADYNHVLNWLGPMYVSTMAYFAWNLWNITALDALYEDAVAADEAGDVTMLLSINDEMNAMVNDAVYYFWMFYDTDYFIRSSYLKGWYYNPALGVEYFATMYYGPTLHPVVLDGVTYYVATLSNSTLSDFAFSALDRKISFNVTGPDATIGYCNVTIPKTLLRADPYWNWTIILSGRNITADAIITENDTHTFIYFTYTHSPHHVQIIGTWAVPEFPSIASLLLSTALSLIAIVSARKRLHRKIDK